MGRKKLFLTLLLFLLAIFLSSCRDMDNNRQESLGEETKELEIMAISIPEAKGSPLESGIEFKIDNDESAITSRRKFNLPDNKYAALSFVTNADIVCLDGVEITTGATVLLKPEYELLLKNSQGQYRTYTLRIQTYNEQSNTELPQVCINTENKISISSAEEYVEGTLSIISGSEQEQLESTKAGFKIRGNSTQGFPKKSYRIKLDKAADIFGYGTAKNWMLVANYTDKSLIRNMMAMWISSEMKNINYTVKLRAVELYVNNEYVGVYTLGDHIETGRERVNVETGSSYYDTGFLIEADIRAPQESRPFFEVGGMYYSVLAPKNPTDEQVGYIKNYYERIYFLLTTGNEKVWDYLDMKTCVDWLIVKEACCGTGIPYDVYMYKDAGGKLCFGPVWDFDLAFGNADYGNADKYDRFYTCYGHWTSEWFEYESFMKLFLERWDYMYTELLPRAYEQMWVYYQELETAAERNFKRWDILNTYVWPNPEGVMQANTFKKQIEFLEYFLDAHTDWVNTELEKYR